MRQGIGHSANEALLGILCNDPYCHTEHKHAGKADRIQCASNLQNQLQQMCLAGKILDTIQDAWCGSNSEYIES